MPGTVNDDMVEPNPAPRRRTLSTAPARREAVLVAAIRVFGQTGYRGTSVSTVAAEAGISEAYVFRLFEGKQALFIATVRSCFERIQEALRVGAAEVNSSDPDELLAAMAAAYADLVTERDLLMLQVHALAASDEVAIRAAMTDCYRDLVTHVQSVSNAAPDAVQTFFAKGQYYHLLTALGLFGDLPDSAAVAEQDWARMLTHGMMHVPVPVDRAAHSTIAESTS